MKLKAQPVDDHNATVRRSYPRTGRLPLPTVLVTLLAITLASCAASARPAPDFALVNQFGRITRLADLKGRTVLLTFLFTHCPDTCPLYLSNVVTALGDGSANESDRPIVVVVTVDPDRDTVERLQTFAGAWPDDWLFLTGRYQEVASVWRSYGVTARKQPLSHAHSSDVHEGYTVAHDGKLSIIRSDGVLAGELVGSWTAEDLRTSLRTVSDRPAGALLQNPWPALENLIRKCGDFAAARPELFVSLMLLAALPGLILPIWLLWTFLRGPRRRKPVHSSTSHLLRK